MLTLTLTLSLIALLVIAFIVAVDYSLKFKDDPATCTPLDLLERKDT